MELLIVPYQECYKQQLFAFTEHCFTELGKSFEPEGRHSFYNDIALNFIGFWCMLADNEVAGTVALKELSDSTAELKALYLAEKLRGNGTGKLLLNTALSFAKEAGYKYVVLDSMSKYTAALKLYEKTGFKYISRFNDNIYADVFMKLEL